MLVTDAWEPQVNGVVRTLSTVADLLRAQGDVVEVITAPVSAPNPAWLGFVRTGRARSKIRHHLKTMAQTESVELG